MYISNDKAELNEKIVPIKLIVGHCNDRFQAQSKYKLCNAELVSFVTTFKI